MREPVHERPRQHSHEHPRDAPHDYRRQHARFQQPAQIGSRLSRVEQRRPGHAAAARCFGRAAKRLGDLVNAEGGLRDIDRQAGAESLLQRCEQRHAIDGVQAEIQLEVRLGTHGDTWRRSCLHHRHHACHMVLNRTGGLVWCSRVQASSAKPLQDCAAVQITCWRPRQRVHRDVEAEHLLLRRQRHRQPFELEADQLPDVHDPPLAEHGPVRHHHSVARVEHTHLADER
jgi:hypothetical protein